LEIYNYYKIHYYHIFCDEESLKPINKLFLKLNYEKYNTHIQPHGLIETYYLKTKKVESRKTYKNGKLNGSHETWWPGGQLWEKTNYKSDKKSGLTEVWYPNGKLCRMIYYRDGKRNGLHEL